MCKLQDVLDGIFELLVFCYYDDVSYLVGELFELCIGRRSLFEEEAAKLKGFPSSFLVNVTRLA